uniref:Uncharacterized protein n=1 Tax=Spodoptera frugiperda nuclear polyhedrosis virus TaxID=10455 RepID=A0A7G3W7Q1_NPVSF|nr:hypothetical protein [Spodoptera frugiperda multiple nucleopolyhedrovirus]
MLSHDIICYACEKHTNKKYNKILVEFVNNHANTNICTLMDRILLAFEVDVVYEIVENVKSIIWAVVKIVYARNRNLPSFQHHLPFISFAATLIPQIANSKDLYNFSKSLYKRFCVYEMKENYGTFDDVISILKKLDSLCTVVE